MSRLEEFCGNTDDHDEHEWTDRHERDFWCPGRPDETMITPFDWHAANKEGFLSWAIIVMLSDGVNDNVAERVLEVSDGAKKLLVTLDINGVSFDAVPFFERLWQEMQHQAKARAAELVEDELAKIRATHVDVERLMGLATADIKRRFTELGLPMEDDDYV